MHEFDDELQKINDGLNEITGKENKLDPLDDYDFYKPKEGA